MQQILSRFAEIIELAEPNLNLAEAAFVIAQAAGEDAQPDRWLRALDRLALDIGDLERLRTKLFHEMGFTGNAADYYDPENSLLNRVMERRTGIPITLSLLTMEVGRRAGIELDGIGMPGHFLVRDVASGIYIDAFHGGRMLDELGCADLFRSITGDNDLPLTPELLPIASKREILARMLGNLKTIYRAQGEWPHVEWTVRMRLSLEPRHASEVVELAEALALQGRLRDGAAELESRAAEHPQLSEDLLPAARELRARLN